MRTVLVFPETDLERVAEQISVVAREQQGGQWVIGDAAAPTVYVSVDTKADELFSDWEPTAVAELQAILGRLPAWAVVCDVSGRVPGDDEIRALVLELLADGGVAVDDFSDHCWTAGEIAADQSVDGLRFFDYRTSFQRSRRGGA